MEIRNKFSENVRFGSFFAWIYLDNPSYSCYSLHITAITKMKG